LVQNTVVTTKQEREKRDDLEITNEDKKAKSPSKIQTLSTNTCCST